MIRRGCPHPAVRAATLIRAPEALTLATVTVPEPVEVAVACLRDHTLLALLPPGRLSDSVRSTDCEPALITAAALSAGPQAREHATLHLQGTLRAVPPGGRTAAALALCDVAHREELLDTYRPDGWLLVSMVVGSADWRLACGRYRVPLDELFNAAVDEVLLWSPRLCVQLNASHPEVALQLAGRPAWLAELDRDGATLRVHDDPRQDFLRVYWPSACSNLHDLHHVLADYAPPGRCRQVDPERPG